MARTYRFEPIEKKAKTEKGSYKREKLNKQILLEVKENHF